MTWSCVASVNFRPEPARCVAFSTDGSLLAVSYGRHITLWHPLEVRPLPFCEFDYGEVRGESLLTNRERGASRTLSTCYLLTLPPPPKLLIQNH